MKPTFEEYRREVIAHAEEAAQLEQMNQRFDHLEAFNFGRTVQRLQRSRYDTWLRVGWLLVGLVVGVTCGRAYPDYLYPAMAHKLLTRATQFVQTAGRSGLTRVWKIPRLRI